MRRYLPRARDVVMGVLCVVAWMGAMSLAHRAGWYPSSWWAYRLAGVLSGLVLAVRRRYPGLTFLGVVAFDTAMRPQALSVAEFLLVPALLAGWTATETRRLPWWVTLPGLWWTALLLYWPWPLHGLVEIALPPYSAQSGLWYFDVSRLGALAVACACTVAVAVSTGRQRLLTTQLRERNAELERLRSVESEQVVAAERTRIARELHDIVAHHITAIVLRAQAADRVADADPAQPREAVRWIATSGQEALRSMRHVVRVLRTGTSGQTWAAAPASQGESALDVVRPLSGFGSGGTAAPLHPEGGWADLSATAERLRAVGMQVELPAAVPQLPLPLDLAVARIVQESLTNALVHGHATRARVQVSAVGGDGGDGGLVEVIVDDDGTAGAPTGQAPASATGGGNGVVGMRERAASHGGGLFLECSPWGGWRVRARMVRQTEGAA